MKLDNFNIREQRERLGLSQAKLAELTNIPQHLLSAAELGKLDLDEITLRCVHHALADDSRVRGLASRPKRYKVHEYGRVNRSSERASLASQTPGNAGYICQLEHLHAQHTRSNRRTLSAISLFSGCGGLSLGFSAAGYAIKGFLELDESLRRIYKRNFAGSEELGGDIVTVRDAELARLAERLFPINVLIGGPPCQGFSLSGKRDVTDPRNTLFRHYLRFVRAIRPSVAILENVRLLTSMRSPSGSLVADDISTELSGLGYAVRRFDVNAKCFGVPQHRERVFFVAVSKLLNKQPSFPPGLFGAAGDLYSSAQPYRSFGDACSDLAFIESGESSDDPLHTAVTHPSHVVEWLWDVPQGSSAHDNADERLRPPSGYNTTYKRQVWGEPASTVQTTFGMISGCRNVHPIATRSLTIREAARIQSFPDGFGFCGNQGTMRTAIGNAVPPLLAYAIANHVKELVA